MLRSLFKLLFPPPVRTVSVRHLENEPLVCLLQMAEVDLNESNSGALIGTAAVLLILTWISVLLRTYVRAILTKAFQNDDWFMLAAQVRVNIYGGDSLSQKA